MTQFEQLLSEMNADQAVILPFFAAFSRFEFALKQSGYAIGEDSVSANWDRFAADLDANFDRKRTVTLAEAVDYLIKHPPKKQARKGGVLIWVASPAGNARELANLLIYVRRLRNNLFHGGKYPGLVVDDPGRDTTLLRHGLTILDECLTLCDQHSPKVSDAFYGRE